MTGFPINPPRAAVVSTGGFVTPEWYRYFSQIQAAVGASATATWQDGFLLVSPQLPSPAVTELEAGGAMVTVRTVTTTTDWIVQDNDCIILGDASGSGLSVLLPLASRTPGRQLMVKKIDSSANAVTLTAQGGETIDGSGTLDNTTQYASYTVVSNGTGWYIV